ncbi:hypothetical protein, partial [Streptomyces sp. MB09-02B]|uniref:hypothetical protein n=1 Tax=Streptomyces sp. MB09-02B TaxID=3028667 RepID=UPI0029B5B0F1
MRDMAVPEADPAVPARASVSAGTFASAGISVPVRLAAVFLPAPLPRHSRFAFWDPAGADPPPGAAEDLTVVRPHGSGARRGTVPALCLPVGEALPLLT